MKHLQSTLSFAGKQTLSANFSNGSRLLVLPDHGRLIGLYPAGEDTNFLWTTPALATAESAEEYFRRSGWPNPGGDRTWLAPELDLFIADPARVGETYAVPRALDPGNWRLVSATPVEVNLENRTRLRLLRSGSETGVWLAKKYAPADNPLQGTLAGLAGLQYAGYTLATALELEPGEGSPVRLGIWSLLQLPQPGTMLIPTRAVIRPQVVFGTPTPGELTAEPHLVRWHMAPPGGDAKISIKANALTGRAGYLRDTGMPGIQDLVVRDFTVGVDDDYVDALWEPPHEAGWAFQACCVRSGAECFNELEYHAPAAMTAPGRNISRDESRVWAFRGPTAAVLEAACHLLGDAVVG